ncbi:MAG: flagellar hook-length control protein FliK [Candidatus Thiodiazotropha sp. (ex Lucinoma borealis)]|nr:flagellar hook-length control protein FliK [Candidatus Thiodiazotropha sp. (ex Lucinoma borealis)]
MAQIPTMNQIQGGNLQTTTSGDSDSSLLEATTEGMAMGIPFYQALQELLVQEGDGQLLLSLQPGVDTAAPSPMILAKDGTVLPFQPLIDGKSLPVLTDQVQIPRVEQVTDFGSQLRATQPLQPEFLTQRLFQADQSINLPVAVPSGEESKLLLDAGRVAESVSQYSAVAIQQPSTTSQAARPAMLMPLEMPVGQPGWDKAVGERIQWMVSQNIQQAEIKLTPPNLGPLEIKISLQNDQTTVSFVAAQAPTREALEASIPRLREMFGEINLNLANVDVGQQQTGESTADGKAESGSGRHIGDELSPHESFTGEAGVRMVDGMGLLDTYA